MEMNRRRREGFGYNVGFIYSGYNYEPGIGFVDRENFKFGKADASYTWMYGNDAPFIWQRIQVSGNTYFDNFSGKALSVEFGPEWSVSTRALTSIDLGVKYYYENLLDPFVLSDDAAIPEGAYNFLRLLASYDLAGERLLSTGITLETGTFYDGWLNSILFTPSWNVSKHLELSLEYSFNQANFWERDEDFIAHILRLRIGTAVNTKISTNAFVQYNSLADLFAANIRFRYNFREGNDLWIVFNEGLNTNRNQFSPKLPLSDSESILVKYIYTFQF